MSVHLSTFARFIVYLSSSDGNDGAEEAQGSGGGGRRRRARQNLLLFSAGGAGGGGAAPNPIRVGTLLCFGVVWVKGNSGGDAVGLSARKIVVECVVQILIKCNICW